MKPEKVNLNELNDKKGPFTIKVRVIDKARPQVSPRKGKRFQAMTLKDDEGNRMRATLFDDEIEAYTQVLEKNKDYHISNATVKKIVARYERKPNEFQMTFNYKTLIEPLDSNLKNTGQKFRSISSIPRTVVAEDRFDILGVVVYIEPVRQVTVRQITDRSVDVREIVITDHSSDHVLIISAWNDFAIKECVSLEQMIHSFPIVGFTSLNPTLHKGFALSTTMSSLLILDPTGEKTLALKDWASSNLVRLLDCETRVRQVRMPSSQRVITAIQTIKSKKANAVLQEEHHWLHVRVPNFDNKDVRMYQSCSSCSKHCDGERAAVIQCTYNRFGCTSVPSINYNFDAHDSTGSLSFTAFTEDSEALLNVKAETLFDMPNEERVQFYEEAATMWAHNSFYMQVGPAATSLAHNRVLKWVLKLISLQ